jgi:hypothetical protein
LASKWLLLFFRKAVHCTYMKFYHTRIDNTVDVLLYFATPMGYIWHLPLNFEVCSRLMPSSYSRARCNSIDDIYPCACVVCRASPLYISSVRPANELALSHHCQCMQGNKDKTTTTLLLTLGFRYMYIVSHKESSHFLQSECGHEREIIRLKEEGGTISH